MSSPEDQAGMSGTKCSTMGKCAGTCLFKGCVGVLGWLDRSVVVGVLACE